jgi:hypothetical protein
MVTMAGESERADWRPGMEHGAGPGGGAPAGPIPPAPAPTVDTGIEWVRRIGSLLAVLLGTAWWAWESSSRSTPTAVIQIAIGVAVAWYALLPAHRRTAAAQKLVSLAVVLLALNGIALLGARVGLPGDPGAHDPRSVLVYLDIVLALVLMPVGLRARRA